MTQHVSEEQYQWASDFCKVPDLQRLQEVYKGSASLGELLGGVADAAAELVHKVTGTGKQPHD